MTIPQWFDASKEVPGDDEVVYLFCEDKPLASLAYETSAPIVIDAYYDEDDKWYWGGTKTPISTWLPLGWRYKGDHRVNNE